MRTSHLLVCTFKMPVKQKENEQSPTVHSHGCNCLQISEDWLTDWSDDKVTQPNDVDKNMWEEVVSCRNLKQLLMKKRDFYMNDRHNYEEFVQHIYPFAVKKLKTNIAQEIVKALTLPRREGERTAEFEAKINSMCTPDGEQRFEYYHKHNHWSPDCYACQVQHDSFSESNLCNCTICGDFKSKISAVRAH